MFRGGICNSGFFFFFFFFFSPIYTHGSLALFGDKAFELLAVEKALLMKEGYYDPRDFLAENADVLHSNPFLLKLLH